MQKITSKDNSLIKHVKKLKEKKYRNEYNEYIVEGAKIIGEAIKEKAKIKQIIICDGCEKDELIERHLKYELAKYDCIYVPQNIFKMLTDVENPQGVLAVIEKGNLDGAINYDEDLIIALDDVQDPGNVGTILRTIDSVGLNQIIISKETADAYNPKVVRSTMGAIFRVKIIIVEDIVAALKEMQKNKYEIVATSLETKDSIYDVDYNKKVIVIGNEANGVSKEVLEIADIKAKIPMLGKTESLNASVATSIILYEYVRQKIME